jgi:hypothetical protein
MNPALKAKLSKSSSSQRNPACKELQPSKNSSSQRASALKNEIVIILQLLRLKE